MTIEAQAIRACVTRMTARACGWLRHKELHWGDPILCDGMVRVAREFGSNAPMWEAAAWFAPRLASGPDTRGWIWVWSAEALPAIDLYLLLDERRYLDYARAVIDGLEHAAAHTSDGAVVPHPPALEVWVDMAYFTAPAMARLGRITDDAVLVERALDQLLVHQRHLQDAASGLFWHVAYLDKGAHSAHPWARGNSWFSIAATEVLGEVRAAGLESRFRNKTAPLDQALVRQLEAVMRLQDAGGLWHTVLDRDDSYLESSAAAGFALALGRAPRLGLDGLDVTRARQAWERALGAVCAKVDAGGDFTGVSQQTPPGDFAHYQSIEVGTAPFGTGVCLMALSEAFAALGP